MIKRDLRSGKYMEYCLLYRDVTPKDVNMVIASIRTNGTVQFVVQLDSKLQLIVNLQHPDIMMT